MKLNFRITLALQLLIVSAFAQTSNDDLKKQLLDAQKAVDAKNYKEVNFQLQMAMNTVSAILGEEVMKLLPTDINGILFVKEEDKVTNASLMSAGTTIQRYYRKADSDGNIEIMVMANSPLVASLGMVLNNPMFASQMASSGQKVVSIGNRRALLRLEKESKNAEIQVVFGQHVVTINASSIINSESDIISIASKIDYAKIEALLGN